MPHRCYVSGARLSALAGAAVLAVLVLAPAGAAAQNFAIKPIAEKKIAQLPSGPLFWQIETFPTVSAAQAAAGSTSLAAEANGKVYLFTLGAKDAPARGGDKVVTIGPVPPIQASEYLLRINNAGGPPGARTQVHTHPGSEAFYVLAGRLSQRTPEGVHHVDPGQFVPGHGAGTPMEVSSSGAGELTALVMFVVDATKPFSTPAKME